jgi:hypothetical protein
MRMTEVSRANAPRVKRNPSATTSCAPVLLRALPPAISCEPVDHPPVPIHRLGGERPAHRVWVAMVSAHDQGRWACRQSAVRTTVKRAVSTLAAPVVVGALALTACTTAAPPPTGQVVVATTTTTTTTTAVLIPLAPRSADSVGSGQTGVSATAQPARRHHHHRHETTTATAMTVAS